MDQLLFPALILIVLVFMVTRQRKQQREQTKLRNAVQPGQRVMTTAGLFGTVIAVDDTMVKLEIAPGVVVEYVIGAVARVVPAEVEAPADSAAEAAPDLEVSPDPELSVVDLHKATRPDNQA